MFYNHIGYNFGSPDSTVRRIPYIFVNKETVIKNLRVMHGSGQDNHLYFFLLF